MRQDILLPPYKGGRGESHEVRMTPLDDGLHLVPVVGRCHTADVQFVGVFFLQLYLDTVFLNESFGGCQVVGRAVAQHLQAQA